MDRRTFVEALSAVFLAANAPLFGESRETNVVGSGGLETHRGNGGSIRCAIPIPASVAGVRDPVIDLAGSWKFCANPSAEFWKQNIDASAWSSVGMPNEFAMLGFSIVPNCEYPCARKVQIPADYQGKRIFIRFDGVYSYARVWINGVYLRDHWGGFTAWDCEITDHVKAGEEATLVLGITDRSDDISQASYYAKHSIAGVLRNVRLFALPVDALISLTTAASLDGDYKDGVIRLEAEFCAGASRSSKLAITLIDGQGKGVAVHPDTVSILPRQVQGVTPSQVRMSETIHVPAPKHWDAEHPNLYTLEISVLVDGQTTQTLRRKIGFRTVKRAGNQLLVNGEPVKLRGVCRHSIHPLQGRAVSAEYDAMDAALFRAANINFVRTSHYPPTEAFLDACDLHGIYLEEETAVCWSAVDGGVSSDTEFAERFLSQFEEMIGRDRDRASVLFWSLGNESYWGKNFAAEHKFAAEQDPSRPTIFSFPDTVSMDPPAPWKPMVSSSFEIYSKHYADVHSDLRSPSYPLLNDEFAHVACYKPEVLRRDPGIRNFWGESIRRFGEKFLADDGCLGGAIWAAIDEIFLMPDGPVGYGPWGIVDGWRRPKPEYWLTKKAYSPIRIEDRPLAAPAQGAALTIPIRNAFDHTNLKEIEIRWSAGADSGRVQIDLPPHHSGYLEIPARHWNPGDLLTLEFHEGDKSIDEFRLAVGPRTPPVVKHPTGHITLHNEEKTLVVTGETFKITVSQTTGLVRDVFCEGQVILKGGPYLDYGSGPMAEQWILRSCVAAVTGDTVTIQTIGQCKHVDGIDGVPVEFEMEIDGAGLIVTRYRITGGAPANTPVGIAYLLPASVDKLEWRRDALWSVYPEDHIGRAQGVASKQIKHPHPGYRLKPEWAWSEDAADAFLWGRDHAGASSSNDFRSLKESIHYARLSIGDGNMGVCAEAEGDIAVRASVLVDGRVCFSLYNYWPYPDLAWGNYTGPGDALALTIREVRLRLMSRAGA